MTHQNKTRRDFYKRTFWIKNDPAKFSESSGLGNRLEARRQLLCYEILVFSLIHRNKCASVAGRIWKESRKRRGRVSALMDGRWIDSQRLQITAIKLSSTRVREKGRGIGGSR